MSVQIWLHSLQHQPQPASGRQQSRIARQLLDLACQANKIELTREQLELPGLALLEFLQTKHHMAVSISHCKQLVAIALSRNRLGIDCEAPGRRNDCQGIADNYFRQEEAQNIRNRDAKHTEEAFLRHWVLKESMVKANRASVLTDLNMLVINTASGCATVYAPAYQSLPWHVWEGRFSQCFLALSSASVTRPSLTFFESLTPATGAYTRCDDSVKGAFITTTAATI